MSSSEDEHYGMPNSAVQQAQESHKTAQDRGITRMGLFVPTRHEVRTMPPESIETMLDLWMYESPVEIIPSDSQIRDVRKDLQSRADAYCPEVQRAIQLCDRYIKGPDQL